MTRQCDLILQKFISEVMKTMGVFRFFHTGVPFLSNKSALAILRKKTGYSFGNIRKALELNDNDIVKAEKWLVEQAKAMGWDKVAKVIDRKAVQGLIGVTVKNKKVAMVEVNCETDFVSSNDKFRSLVELVTKTCLQQPVLSSGLNVHKVHFSTEELGKLHTSGGSLADHLAVLIGSMGEKMELKRAICYETSRNDIEIAAAVHPHSENSGVLLGKYGAFITYQRNPETPIADDLPDDVPGALCTHIIGMNPTKIGEFGKDEPTDSDETEETVLIHQDFLLDESVTVGQLLTNAGITILDFKRFKCGEPVEEAEVDSSENCENAIKVVKA